MAQPLIASGNRIRLSPLEKAVVASKAPGGSGEPRASGLSSLMRDEPDVLGTPDEVEPGLDPQNPAHVQAAIEAAKSGDQGAIDWLKTIGLGTGVLAAGTAAAYASGSRVKNIMNDQRGGKFGAKDIAKDAAPVKLIPDMRPKAGVAPDVVYSPAARQPIMLPAPSEANRPPGWSPNDFAKRNNSARTISQALRGIR